MEEKKKEIKVSLGTIVCIFIIVLLVIALIGMMYYYNKDNVRSTENVLLNEKENKEGSNQIGNTNNQAEKNISNSKEYIKSISLNGNSHEIAFIYSNTQTDETNDLIWDEIEVLFDDKVIKTFYDIYRLGKEKEEPEVKTIIGEDNKEYAIIIINTYAVEETNYFTFVNEKGEVLGTIDNYTGTSISYNGEELKYEIKQNGIRIYEPIARDEIAAIGYDVRVYQNVIDASVAEVYSNNEVEMAGAKP